MSNTKNRFTHIVKCHSGTIRANIEAYLPDDPTFGKKPFGMRLENGNFMWCNVDKIERRKQ